MGRDANATLRALFDTALDGIVLVDDDARFVDVNPAGCGMLGRPRDRVLQLRMWDVVHADRLARARELFNEFLRLGQLTGSFELIAADGSAREVEYRFAANVQPGLHLSIVRDVTARNAARRDTEQRLQSLNTQIRHVSARARARREEDRTRLARELHDQLGQSLASLKIDLCWLTDRLVGTPIDLPDLHAKTQAMTALVDETIVRVRRLSSELRPPVLDRLGLIAAIEWEIGDFQRRSGIHVRLQSQLEQVPLDLGRSTAVFRIFQEALANVASHADASQVTVRMSLQNEQLKLAVSDDGCGIPQPVLDSAQSLGLMGMRERAELLGGGVDVRANPRRGTTVTVAVPLRERRQSPRDVW